MINHILRQMAFSRGAFGPGERRASIIEHIRRELIEVEESDGSPTEWVDVVILALDGLWRSIETVNFKLFLENEISEPLDVDLLAKLVFKEIVRKQGINERRTWPDWRTLKDGEPSEHVR